MTMTDQVMVTDEHIKRHAQEQYALHMAKAQHWQKVLTAFGATAPTVPVMKEPSTTKRDRRRTSPGAGFVQLAAVLTPDLPITAKKAAKLSKVPQKSVEKYLTRYGHRVSAGVYQVTAEKIAEMRNIGQGKAAHRNGAKG
jgi:hypothetical protein